MTTPAAKAANADATMEGQYTFVQDLVSTIPELAAMVKKAEAQGASPDAFEAMLESTNWWRTNASTARTMIATEKSDPATYAQDQAQAKAHVEQLAAQMGVTLSSAQISSFATSDLFQGLNDDQLKANLGGTLTAGPQAGTPTGDVAAYTSDLQQLAASYGLPVTASWTNSYIQKALSGGQTEQEMIAGAQADLQQQATSMYPSLTTQLQAGQTVQQIAQPYVAAMSQILELPETNIGVNDPTIQKALTNSTLIPGAKPQGTGTAPTAPSAPQPSTAGTANQPGATSMPLYQFQDMLRQDPRWQQTDNAKASAYSMVANLGKEWGFST